LYTDFPFKKINANLPNQKRSTIAGENDVKTSYQHFVIDKISPYNPRFAPSVKTPNYQTCNISSDVNSSNNGQNEKFPVRITKDQISKCHKFSHTLSTYKYLKKYD